MNLTIDNKINNINGPVFKGPLDGTLTTVLRACDMNEMVNAVGIDVGAMVLPRTYYDMKHRNKYAGTETFIREISGTFINCLSAGIFASLISKVANKCVMPDVQINPKSWYSKASIETLNEAWNKEPNIEAYAKNIFENLSGVDGFNQRKIVDIDWKNIEWIDEKAWENIKWDNVKYKDIFKKLTTKEGLATTLATIIKDDTITKKDRKNILKIMESRLVNTLGAEREVRLNINNKELSSTAENLLRDSYEMGRDIFKKNINKDLIFKKIAKVNNIKTFGAIILSCLLGLTNQHYNRKLSEKRSGKKGFVGNVDYISDNRKEEKKDKTLIFKKILASLGMIGMVLSVMRVKNFKDFAKKLEFTGPITSGNAIKTVYASNIVGRMMAADDGTELRESVTRDYFGFLNWLVFGGFAAKGVANLLDKKGEALFNYSKKGKGLKHWLNDMCLKTHKEIAAKGKDFAKKNMWKINVAQIAGIAYSAITLGLLLPMINAKLTKYEAINKQKNVTKENNIQFC